MLEVCRGGEQVREQGEGSTDQIQLNSLVLSTEVAEEGPGGVAVGAVRFREDHFHPMISIRTRSLLCWGYRPLTKGVLVDQALSLGLSGGHSGGRGAGKGAEESGE